jgi:1-acyl-sn-glycerol-3-phosphate acyltransferase
MRLGYRVCRGIAQLLYIAFFQGRVFGMRHVPQQGGVILVSNHQSFYDPVLATLAIPRECSYMARDSLFEHPVLERVIRYLNAFPVRRQTADMRAIKELIRRLRAGHVILTFPEGTRTADGSIGSMLGGVALVARKTMSPMVPTLIQGAFEAWPRTAKRPGLHPVLVAYGEPVWPHKQEGWDDEACMEAVRERLVGMQARYGGIV